MRTWTLATLALLLTGCGSDEAADGRAVVDLATGQPVRAITQTAPSLGPLPGPPKGTGDGYRSDFERIFTDGLVIDRPDERITVAVDPAGTLTLGENGYLLAGDPLGPDTPVKLPVRLLAQPYPVQVSRAHIQTKDGSGTTATLIAAARLLVAPGTATQWHWIGQYSLDSGLGAFLSESAGRALHTRRDTMAKAIVTAIEADPEIATSIPTRPAAPPDLTFFPAGTGEGSVELYVGVDASGAPVQVVADFLVLVEPEEIMASISKPLELAPGNLQLPTLDALAIHLRRARPDEIIPLTGGPCWFVLDASAIARDPRISFPRIACQDAQGQPITLAPITEGYRLWLPPPPQGVLIDTLSIIIQMGVKSL